MLRSDIRTRVRDYLYEPIASVWSDAQLNRLYEEESRSLPTKGIYLSTTWEADLTDDQTITLPTNISNITRVERNFGSVTTPDWDDIDYWESFGNMLRFSSPITASIRASLRSPFTIVSDDTIALDIPDDISELLVWGIVVRAYRMLIGYLRSNISWDSVTKPDGLSLSVVQGFLRDAKLEYDRLVKQYQTLPRVRDIGLTS